MIEMIALAVRVLFKPVLMFSLIVFLVFLL